MTSLISAYPTVHEGMEQKHILLSALGAGIGVGVGLGLASGQSLSKWSTSDPSNDVTQEKVAYEMLKCVVNGKESDATFDQFPYYLSEQTRVVLTSAAYVHLKHDEFSKHTRNLSPASRSILLSGPAELYQQMLGKALAHYFDAKLLLLDGTDFSLKIKNKYGNMSKKENSLKRSISEAALERFSGFLSTFSSTSTKCDAKGGLRRQSSGTDIASRGIEGFPKPSGLRRNVSASDNIDTLTFQQLPSRQAPLKRTSSWMFDEKLFVQALYRVILSVTKTNPLILYLRDADKLILKSSRMYNLFSKMLKKITGRVLILGSRMVDPEQDYREVDEKLHALFPYNLEIKPPVDESHLVNWKSKLEEDMKIIQFQDTKNHILEVLASNDLECDDLDSICLSDTVALGQYIEEIVVSAISYHLMNNKNPQYRNGKLVISSKSLSHGLNLFQDGKNVRNQETKAETVPGAKSAVKTGSPAMKNKTETEIAASSGKKDEDNAPAASKEAPPDNEFEKRIRPDVVSANEINVTFADIGALAEIKESLQELVMLPLRRPDLFKGGLLKPCRGILLFGPPGTGKTMLAKAIAKEAGASFINVSMSTITSKWFGEDEKNVRALFSLAAKVAPSIIFVDEVDSMLGQRTRAGEHEAMRKIKNEFMTHWDGVLTGCHERILVLAATNRPFDLDEAIIRRFERRIMVGLPSVENREMILKTLLSKEKVSKELDYRELATMTEGYSGSDLKNFCTTAAYRPVRELIQEEGKKEAGKAESNGEECNGSRVITLRPLNTEDFRSAKDQVAASFAAEGSIMNELKQWNDLYGEGGSRKKKQHLSYFL